MDGLVPHGQSSGPTCLTNGVFTPEQDNDKTNVEPVHSYDAFHSRHVGPGVKGIIVGSSKLSSSLGLTPL